MVKMLNYDDLIKRHPWVISKNQKAILSPDSDGILCGLLMSHFLDWEIVGFYDGKVLLLDKKLSPKECVFLDMEIFREGIRSVGQHMLMYDIKDLPDNWKGFRDSISPNNIRGFDYFNHFQRKYPLATVHFLISILGKHMEIRIPESAICPLLYTDGTFKNLFNYPENCISWLNFMGADLKENPLFKVFYNEHYTVMESTKALSAFFVRLADINDGKRGGDKIKLSDAKGNVQTFDLANGYYALRGEHKAKAEELLVLLSGLTGWGYKPDLWRWEGKKLFCFSKGTTKPGKRNYSQLMKQSPISFAITSTLAIEYTLEGPDKIV